MQAIQAGQTSVRGIAREAEVALSTANRVISDLERLGAIQRLRPGRDALITWRQGPVGDWFATLQPPALDDATEATFAANYAGPGTVLRWSEGDVPVRLAVLTGDEDAAWDAIDAALDAVAEARWPSPDVSIHDPATLSPDDPVDAELLSRLASS